MLNSRRKIALLVTYFGQIPEWFPAFQVSCEYNPAFEWLIFSDAPPPPTNPDNVTFIPFSVERFCKLASAKLKSDIRISEKYLYKICDFKPAFGIIYEDYLTDYNFWGHCDIDIIWGDISKFISDDIYENYDIITSRPGRISGHFCLYRNTTQVNSVFLTKPYVRKFLQETFANKRLDEDYFSNYLHGLTEPSFLSTVRRFLLGKPFIPRVFWRDVLTTSGAHQRALISRDGRFTWKQGKVFHISGTEMMYLHFHLLKNKASFQRFEINDRPEGIIVNKEGIVSIA